MGEAAPEPRGGRARLEPGASLLCRGCVVRAMARASGTAEGCALRLLLEQHARQHRPAPRINHLLSRCFKYSFKERPLPGAGRGARVISGSFRPAAASGGVPCSVSARAVSSTVLQGWRGERFAKECQKRSMQGEKKKPKNQTKTHGGEAARERETRCPR